MWTLKKIGFKNIAVAVSVLTLGVLVALPSHTRSLSSDVREAQTIMTKFGLPTGPTDGIWGPQTARGICAFRMISGLPINRSRINSNDLNALRNFDAHYATISQVPAPNKNLESYLDLNKTCQVMAYVEGNQYQRVMPVSTGRSGYDTLKQTSYTVDNTIRGWHCSGQYPEGCGTMSTGRFTSISNYGNMYNRRHVTGGVYVHGSTSVPTAPASHGCIRVTTADSDWMYDYVGNNGDVPMFVSGSY